MLPGGGLFASSGYVGLGQQVRAVIEHRRSEFDKQPYATAIRHVQDQVRPLLKSALEAAAIAARALGSAVVQEGVLHSLLVAPFKDGARMVEVTHQGAVEYLTPDLPFISIGSGKPTADPFLGFVRDVFWPKGQPTLQEGTTNRKTCAVSQTDIFESSVKNSERRSGSGCWWIEQ